MTGPKLAPAAPDWDQAACLDVEPELFFTDDEEAIKVCKGCPIKDDCLRFALETRQDHGVWGGLTEQQRAALRKGRAKPEPSPHGTEARDKAHRRAKDKSCPPCVEAARLARQSRRPDRASA